MGLHSPLGYVDYVYQFGITFVNLLDRFCSECHTNRDFNENCRECPIGNLIHKSRDYILSYHISDNEKEKPETDVLMAIKKQVERIEPQPLFDAYFIFDKSKPIDSLHDLSLNLKWLKNLEDTFFDRYRRKKIRDKNSGLIPKNDLIDMMERKSDLCEPDDLHKLIDELAGLNKTTDKQKNI